MSNEIKIGRQTIQVTNLDKVLYPAAGFTKGQVLDYYLRVAPVLLPHLKNRPVTMKRFPDGVEGFFFYEKHCPAHRPRWVDTAVVKGSEKTKGEAVRFCLVNDRPSLAWAAQLANLEFHTVLARVPKIEQPTAMVFDFDPGPPADLIACARVACWVRDALKEFHLESWIKTSGSKGLQLYVPLNKPVSYETVKPFAHELALNMERQHPEEVVSKMSKDLRAGKVFIDWSQNSRHKTTISVYSLRGRERPTVSTPVTWEEIESALESGDARQLVFEAEQVLARIEKHGDLFAPVLKTKQSLPALEYA